MLTAAAAVLGLGSFGDALAPLKTLAAGAKAVPNEYIVKLRADVKDATAHISKVNQIVKRVWKNALNGYAGKFSADALAALRNLPEVEFVEPNGVVGIRDGQWNATWGLVRLSNRNKYAGPDYYNFHTWAGWETTIYVIDTGVRTTHTEFGGRASWGNNFIDQNNVDCHGHGTHVSGTAAGATYGVARKASIVAVKVLGCDGYGTDESVISGIDWVAGQHKAGKSGSRGSVINMSIGGSSSEALNVAANAAVDAGVYVAVAAGNEATDACNGSPASAAKVVTVGATDINDKYASFSNYGKCVKLLAPGVNILSAYNRDDRATAVMSGTSMATPGVAGVLATFASFEPVHLTQDALFQKIKAKATVGAISGIPDGATPNLLAYNGYKQ
ncbi:proteinase T precursor [Ramicandelaber brevisporus]|nr:proteinase T precursor [Ramicandelaber brevisporus]